MYTPAAKLLYTAPFDVRLPHAAGSADAQVTTVIQPDICVIRDPRKLDELGAVGAPDWIIEIISPETMDHAVRTKFSLYEENGVREYWLVTPGLRNVVVYLLIEDRYELGGTYYSPGTIPVQTLAGFSIEWDEVFEGV